MPCSVARVFTAIPAVLLMMPFVIVAGMVTAFSMNGPFVDDYEAILAFLTARVNGDWLLPPTFTSLHNEHRIVTTRLLAWACWQLRGEVSFLWLIAAGNSLLAALAVVLIRAARHAGLQGCWLIPIPCLLLACQSPDNSLGAMQSIQNFGVHTFAALACLQWHRRPVFAVGWGILAAATSANGLFVLPLLVIYSLVNVVRLGRNAAAGARGPLLLAVVVTVVVWGLYFWNYAPPGHHPSPLAILQQPGEAFWFLATLTGSPCQRFGTVAAAISGFGLMMLVAVVLFFQQRSLSGWICLAGFEFLSMVAITAARFQISEPFDSRFRIVPLTFLTVAYVLLAHTLHERLRGQWRKYPGPALAALALGFHLWTVRDYLSGYRDFHHRMTIQMADNPERLDHAAGVNNEPLRESMVKIVGQANRAGVFRWPGGNK